MTEEEKAIFIGEKLWGDDINRFEMTPAAYLEEMKCPNSLDAIERAMIDKGYVYSCLYICNLWNISFFTMHSDDNSGDQGQTKAQAIIEAAYMALKGREDETNAAM